MRAKQEKHNGITDSIANSFKNISELIDVNTVVGKPIKTADNEYIIPISKVTVGILSGGGEYGNISVFSKNSELPFSAGNGSIVSVKPCGFLVKSDDGYKILSVSDKSYEKIFDKATDFLNDLTIN